MFFFWLLVISTKIVFAQELAITLDPFALPFNFIDEVIEEDSSTSPSTTTELPTVPPPEQHDISGQSLSWSPGDEPSIEVTVGEGYSISVTISEVDINGDTQDFLVIKSGDSLDDGGSAGKIFTYTVGKSLKYLFKSTKLFAYYHDVDGNADGKFTITFEKYEEVTTTTPQPTTTTTIWPSTAKGDSTEYTVYIDGRSIDEYSVKEIRDEFRTDVSKMAIAYCTDENVKLLEQITKSNVLLTAVKRCSYNWPKSDKCVKITFKLPIFYDETSDAKNWSGYEYKTDKIEKMWNKYSKKYLSDPLTIYDKPDVDQMLSWWIITIIVVIVAFIIGLGVLRFLASRVPALLRRRRPSDTFSIISSRQASRVSLGPHYLQDTPKLFDNEYPMVDPELQ